MAIANFLAAALAALAVPAAPLAPSTAAPQGDPKKPEAAAGVTLEELWKLTPEERKIRRTAAANAAYEKAKAQAPQGWQCGADGRFFVVTHADQKFVNKVVNLGNSIFEYLEKNFDYVGKTEFVRKPILRVCADSMEFKAKGGDGVWWGGTNLEISTYKDESDGVASDAFGVFAQAVARHWFNERDVDFAMAAPDWLADGLHKAFRSARINDGQLAFMFDEYEYMNARICYRDKQHVTVRQLMVPPPDGETPPKPTIDQVANVVRFYLTGMGYKDTKYREMFRNYLKNYRLAISDVRKAGILATPAQGEADYKNRAEFWKTKKTKLTARAAEQTFTAWKVEDWKALDYAYLQYLTVIK